nr:MAG TPA: hypothetical protein [Caudoviricetes sp.]
MDSPYPIGMFYLNSRHLVFFSSYIHNIKSKEGWTRTSEQGTHLSYVETVVISLFFFP